MESKVMAALEKMNKAKAEWAVTRNRAAAAAEAFCTNKIEREELTSFVEKMQTAEKMFNQASEEYRASY
jgi:arsenate reductase-like glutaredoxin family protein